jgi:hypothetical protein
MKIGGKENPFFSQAWKAATEKFPLQAKFWVPEVLLAQQQQDVLQFFWLTFSGF